MLRLRNQMVYFDRHTIVMHPCNCSPNTETAHAVSCMFQDYTTRSVVLAIGVCYLARLEDATRDKYADFISDKLKGLIGGPAALISGKDYLFRQIELYVVFIIYLFTDILIKNKIYSFT